MLMKCRILYSSLIFISKTVVDIVCTVIRNLYKIQTTMYECAPWWMVWALMSPSQTTSSIRCDIILAVVCMTQSVFSFMFVYVDAKTKYVNGKHTSSAYKHACSDSCICDSAKSISLLIIEYIYFPHFIQLCAMLKFATYDTSYIWSSLINAIVILSYETNLLCCRWKMLFFEWLLKKCYTYYVYGTNCWFVTFDTSLLNWYIILHSC